MADNRIPPSHFVLDPERPDLRLSDLIEGTPPPPPRRPQALLDAPPRRLPPPLGLDYAETPGIPRALTGDLDPDRLREDASRHRSPFRLLPPTLSESTLFRDEDTTEVDNPGNALMPQTQLERERMERNEELGGDVLRTAGLMGSMAGAPFLGSVLGMAGRFALAHPRALLAAGVPTVLSGAVPGPTRSQAPPPKEPENIRTAAERLAALQAAEAEALAVRNTAAEAATRYDPNRILSLDNAEKGPDGLTAREREIRSIQEILGRTTGPDGQPVYRNERLGPDRNGRLRAGPIDGRWEGGTTAAVGAQHARLEQQRREASEAHARAEAAAKAQEAALRGLRGQGLRDQVVANRTWYDDILAGPYGSAISVLGGAGVGLIPSYLMRGGLLASINPGRVRAADEANRLLTRSAPGNVNAQVNDLNEFFVRGRQPPPLRIVPDSRVGYEAANPLPSATDLFRRPGALGHAERFVSRFGHIGDLAPIAFYQAMARATGRSLEEAQRELAEARAHRIANPDNAQAVDAEARLEERVNLLRLTSRGFEGASYSYPGMMFTRPYTQARPDTALAGERLSGLLERARPSVVWESRRGNRSLMQDPATGLFSRDGRGTGETFTLEKLLEKGWHPRRP